MAALFSLLLAALPGNMVDMYRAGILTKSPKKNILHVILLVSLVVCPVSISIIIFEWLKRLSLTLETGWGHFVVSLWSGFCMILIYGAFRDYVLLLREKWQN